MPRTLNAPRLWMLVLAAALTSTALCSLQADARPTPSTFARSLAH